MTRGQEMCVCVCVCVESSAGVGESSHHSGDSFDSCHKDTFTPGVAKRSTVSGGHPSELSSSTSGSFRAAVSASL